MLTKLNIKFGCFFLWNWESRIYLKKLLYIKQGLIRNFVEAMNKDGESGARYSEKESV